MKYSDDLFDVKGDVKLASVFGILCGIASAAATVYSPEAAYIFIAILIGNLIAFKVDGIHHIITLVVFIIICLVCGIPEISYVVLLICILSALGDEIGHEMISKVTENRFFNLFFEYRFLMKVVIFLLAICGIFSVWIFVCFIVFELSYEMAGLLLKNFKKIVKKGI